MNERNSDAPDGPDATDAPDLRALLRDAVSDCEPTDQLAQIRERTQQAPSRLPTRRHGWYAAGAAGLAAAAAITAVAVLAPGGGGPAPDDVDAASSGTHRIDPTTGSVTPTGDTELFALYYVGDTSSGPRLFREFQHLAVPEGPDSIEVRRADVALAALAATPHDPDYSTRIASGEVTASPAELGGADGASTVEVSVLNPTLAGDDLGLQQIYRTMAALDVSVRWNNLPGDAQVRAQPALLSPISISDPVEGEHYERVFIARGRANSYENTVECELLDANAAVVWSDHTAHSGSYLDAGLHAWRITVGLDDVAPGTYVFSCSTAEATEGEGPGPVTDTRTITVG